MTIGEFSERSGLSPKRLRTYAAGGFLVPAAVDPASGYRYYSPNQLGDARLINALREASVPIADIAAILRDPSSAQLDILARRIETDATHRHRALALARDLLASQTIGSGFAGNEQSRKDPMNTWKTGARSDIGKVRENNEDAVTSDGYLVAVADGMGGHPGGEIASSVAISLVQAASKEPTPDGFKAGVRAANRAIWDRASASAELEGMGTTICAAGLVEVGTIAIVNVGDSRAYLLQDGAMTQLTEDHTVTADAVRRGEMTVQEAVEHPYRGVLTRALGVAPDVELDAKLHRVSEGDRLLLCTDGLFNEVAPDEIASFAAEAEDVQSTADGLVELALSRGGHDNVSVVVAEIGSGTDAADRV